jgi:hypothetical protein
MRKRCFGLIVAAVTLPLVSSDVYAACNIRGEFCGRPGWAANAFSNPRDRYPEEALDHPTTRSLHQPYSHKRKLHRRHERG